jgi:hypothetical protein
VTPIFKTIVYYPYLQAVFYSRLNLRVADCHYVEEFDVWYVASEV